jgi:hypothetical protein
MTDQHASQRLNAYIDAFHSRLRRMHLVRALAAMAVAGLALTLGGVFLAIEHGFDGVIINATRAVLVLSLLALAALLWLRPWQRLRRDPGGAIETLTPQFQGRVATWTGMDHGRNPLKELLAEDTLAVADRHPESEQVGRWMLAVPTAVAVGAAGVLLWLAVAGPGLYGYGVRHVWAGWAVKGLLPDQGILVTPGNSAVRRGGSVPVVAQVHGFDPASAQLHARIGAGAWQDVAMSRSKRGFEFTLLSLREPVDYYVSAAGVRSAGYHVDVVEVPTVQNLKVRYRYPAWTHRKSATDDPGGDVNGVSGTEVTLDITTDRPLGAGTLVLDGKDAALDGSGTDAHGAFTIKEDGRYYLAARVGNETVRLTDDYLIKVLPDNKPEIKIAKPGRDWTASNIEEVTAQVQASDDFALEEVELRYAVNGGAWQSVPIKSGGEKVESSQTLMLEDMRVAGENRPLAAGDLISYYATARDRSQATQTDMYFVQVRPYDRKFTESQQMGGGGGGGGGGDNDQTEISKRQKEILVSTWNLIRQKANTAAATSSAAPPASGTAVRDNSVLLSDVQQKLAAQATSLADRAQARELTDQDADIKTFVGHMQDAAKAMQPAAQRLAAVDLEKAIQPEQLALQYLLRAEAVFNDLQMSMQRGGGGGGGRSQSGNDLAQLYDLEMDLQKNQYESGNSASPDASSQQLDDVSRKLAELARRQEQLANEARRSQQMSDEQRWQQEALRREAEQLQQQLNDLQQRQASNQRGQQGQQGQQGQSGQSGQAGQSGDAAGQAGQQLERAITAMNRASEAMRNGADPEQQRSELQRAANEAGRQLSGASQQLSQQRAESIRSQLASLGEQAERAYAAQAASEQQLQESASQAAGARTRTDASAGLNPEQRRQIAGTKRAIGEGVQKLEQDLSAAARRWRSEAPQTADTLQEAGQMLSQGQVQNQLAQSAQYIERGLAAFVVPRESGLTDTLREVRDELRNAQSGAQGATQGQRNDRAVQDALARVQSLRQQVQQLANAQATGQPGQQGKPGQQGQQGQQAQPGQPGQQGQQGQDGQGAQGGQAQSGQPGAGGAGSGTVAGVQRDIGAAGRQIGGIGSVLRAQGAGGPTVAAIGDLARQLQAVSLSGRGDQLNRQLASSLTLLEQLELRLSQSARGANRDSVRTSVNEPVTDEYRDAVAEYYRQLSQD